MAIISGAAGGAAFIVLVVILFLWKRRKGKRMQEADFRDYDPRRVGENRVLPL